MVSAHSKELIWNVGGDDVAQTRDLCRDSTNVSSNLLKKASRMASFGALRYSWQPLLDLYWTCDLCPIDLCRNLLSGRSLLTSTRICFQRPPPVPQSEESTDMPHICKFGDLAMSCMPNIDHNLGQSLVALSLFLRYTDFSQSTRATNDGRSQTIEEVRDG